MIQLKKMNSADFQTYLKDAVERYANEKVEAGNWKQEEAIENSKEVFTNLLPDAEETKNHYIFTILKDNQQIGMIWIAKRTSDEGFVYDFNIDKNFQGLGYGKGAMMVCEYEAKNLGFKKISLHVFGHNKVARGLYETIGYETTNIVMEKEI